MFLSARFFEDTMPLISVVLAGEYSLHKVPIKSVEFPSALVVSDVKIPAMPKTAMFVLATRASGKQRKTGLCNLPRWPTGRVRNDQAASPADTAFLRMACRFW